MLKFLKKCARFVVYRPRGIGRFGHRSKVLRPRWFFSPHRVSIGDDCFIGRMCSFNPLESYAGAPQQGEIVLGNEVYIGGFTQIHAMGRLEIGDGSVLSEHVYVSDIAHGLDPRSGPIMKQPLESKGPVRIGRNVFIGFGSSVLPGVVLGDHCIVGTRSVVTKSFPPYSMIAGSPARRIGEFDHASGRWVHLK